jgi:hypothetical protein
VQRMAVQRRIAGRWRQNARKRPGGKIPQVSLNLDGARRRAKSLHLATVNAAVDEKGPEVIPSEDDDKQGDKATSTMPTKPRKGDRTTPIGKTLSAGRTAPGKAAKLRLGAASNKTQAFARAGMPTATHLTRDDDEKRRQRRHGHRMWPRHGDGAWQRPHHRRPGAHR